LVLGYGRVRDSWHVYLQQSCLEVSLFGQYKLDLFACVVAFL
jgi:hypothetical protein